MNIFLTAQLKTKEQFFKMYNGEYINQKYENNNLLYYASRNTDKEARYDIMNFLLDKGLTVDIETDNCITLLHIVLGHVDHDIKQTTYLCKKLIERGVDINQLDVKNRLAIQYIINLKFSDEELNELYELWFMQPTVDILTKNDWGVSPIELAKKLPYRKKLVDIMEKYISLNNIQ